MDHKYKAAKLESRQKLDLSRDKLDAAAPDIRADMKELEDVGVMLVYSLVQGTDDSLSPEL